MATWLKSSFYRKSDFFRDENEKFIFYCFRYALFLRDSWIECVTIKKATKIKTNKMIDRINNIKVSHILRCLVVYVHKSKELWLSTPPRGNFLRPFLRFRRELSKGNMGYRLKHWNNDLSTNSNFSSTATMYLLNNKSLNLVRMTRYPKEGDTNKKGITALEIYFFIFGQII